MVEVTVFWGDVGEGRAIQRFNGVRISIAHTLVCVASVVERVWCTIFMRGGVEWSTQMSKVEQYIIPIEHKISRTSLQSTVHQRPIQLYLVPASFGNPYLSSSPLIPFSSLHCILSTSLTPGPLYTLPYSPLAQSFLYHFPYASR
jgi:hypothetical protein